MEDTNTPEQEKVWLISPLIKRAILWNVINSLLAGFLIILGALSVGHITLESGLIAILAGITAGVIQFKDFWATQEGELYPKLLFQFV